MSRLRAHRTGLTQAGPKARALERGVHRVIYVGRNLWSHLVQMPCSKPASFSKLGQVAQGEIPEVAQCRVIPGQEKVQRSP